MATPAKIGKKNTKSKAGRPEGKKTKTIKVPKWALVRGPISGKGIADSFGSY